MALDGTKEFEKRMKSIIDTIDNNFNLHATKIPKITSGMKVINVNGLSFVDSGLSCDTFNIIHITNGPEVNKQDLNSVLSYYKERGMAYCLWINAQNLDEKLEGYLNELSLTKQNEEVGMYLNLESYESRYSDKHVNIRKVNSQELLSKYSDVIASNWTPPDKNVIDYYDKTARDYLNGDNATLLLYNGRDGALATVELFPSDYKTIGIYGLATLEDARGKGIGSALMTKALNMAKVLKYDKVVLQASQDGIGIYNKLGFHACTTYYEFA